MTKQSLPSKEYSKSYAGYIDKISTVTDLTTGFQNDKKMMISFFSSIPNNKLNYRYQPEKWSVKEILQHLIDTERIFMYRMLRIARKDTTPLAGFEQNGYIIPSEANDKTIETLLHEFSVTRLYSINLINSISDENMKNMGVASGHSVSARACAFIILGHNLWHTDVIKQYYL
ncbi:DinB family protein [Tenacibaculum sp. UWU-22]|uniref:DinB family protein n=1 Tax=Tenacibaculum sp. UWU-22 TaxID=3234187 RepID=UPI0034DB1CBA